MRATSPFSLALAILAGTSCGGPEENDFDNTAEAGEDPGGSGGSSGASPTGGSATGGSPSGGSSGSGGTTSGEGGTSAQGGGSGTRTGGEGGSAGSGARGGSGGAGSGGVGGGGKGGASGAGAGGLGGGGGGGRGGGGSGGRGGSGGAVICDPGCEPSPNQGNACDEAEVLWNCRNDEGLERFDAACVALPTGDPRFCCPETFSPTCGEGTCSRFPQADEMLCGGDVQPRGYRCLFPATTLPDCVARVAGDVTTIVCCP